MRRGRDKARRVFLARAQVEVGVFVVAGRVVKKKKLEREVGQTRQHREEARASVSFSRAVAPAPHTHTRPPAPSGSHPP